MKLRAISLRIGPDNQRQRRADFGRMDDVALLARLLEFSRRRLFGFVVVVLFSHARLRRGEWRVASSE
jgi:hypothetical protein